MPVRKGQKLGRYRRREKQKLKLEAAGLGVSHLPQEYGWEAMRDLQELVNGNPSEGRRRAVERRGELECFRQRKGLSPTVLQLARCLIVTCRSLEATALRMLRRTEEARCILFESLNDVDCVECVAERERRCALWLLSQGDVKGAEQRILMSIDIYSALGHDGHNLNRNALASCLFAFAHIKAVSQEYTEAVRLTREVLAALDPKVSPSLFRSASINLAAYLVQEGRSDGTAEAEAHLDEVCREQRLGDVERTVVIWIKGQLKARRLEPGAERLFEMAHAGCCRIGLLTEALMVHADLICFYVLSRASMWLIENSGVPIAHPDPRAQAAQEVLREAIRGRDALAIWSAARGLRTFDQKNETTIMPFLLPEVTVIA